jgi:hypothetical protein
MNKEVSSSLEIDLTRLRRKMRMKIWRGVRKQVDGVRGAGSGAFQVMFRLVSYSLQ